MADDMRTTAASGGSIEVTPENPGAVRSEIEATRARMSETIDEIEDVILRKKERIQNRLDVMSLVRERPAPTLGAIFGAGLLLGVVTGGSDDEESYRPRFDGYDRSEEWEGRARRLLAIAQEQEEEIARLRAHHERHHQHEGASHAHAATGGDDGDSAFSRLQDTAAERLSELVRDSVRALLGRRTA